MAEINFMENVYTNNNSKVTKLKTLSNELSPINVQTDNQQFFLSPGRYYNLPPSPLLDSYSLPDGANLENLDSSLIKYLRFGSPVANTSHGFKTPVLDSPKYRQMIGYQFHNSGSDSYGTRGSSRSPLSSIENFPTPPSRSQPLFQTPVKVEEDVLVMDAIQVGSARGRSSSSSDSGSSSSSGNKVCYRTDICRSWEDSGRCRYGSKCQFAHGKEELRPTRFPHKIKSEPQTCKLHSPGSCKNGSKCRFSHLQVTPPPRPSTEQSPTLPTTATTTAAATFATTDWSPQDDGIDVTLPFSTSADKVPSHEEVNAYIHSVLHGPPCRKRLPVFADICTE